MKRSLMAGFFCKKDARTCKAEGGISFRDKSTNKERLKLPSDKLLMKFNKTTSEDARGSLSNRLQSISKLRCSSANKLLQKLAIVFIPFGYPSFPLISKLLRLEF